MDSQRAPGPQHPLRPYAVVPDVNDWASTPVSSSSSPSVRISVPNATLGTTRNRYESTLGEFEHVADPMYDAQHAGVLLKAFVSSSLLSFAGTALVMPFEVGKTLAQVQWVPKEGASPVDWDALEGIQEEDENEEPVELESEAEVEAYFQDLPNLGSNNSAFAPPAPERTRPTSPSGYLMRSGVRDERYGTKPEWIMPVVVQGGVWDMIRTVGRWKGEGWASLWKGQLTTCIVDALATTIQPTVLSALAFLFLPASPLASLPLIYSPQPAPLLMLSTLSHTIAMIAVSPLDLVRTRLIVQSAQPMHRKYTGPWNALRTIMREEGGLRTTYLHPNLLVPAILEGIMRPLIHLSTPLIISRYFQIEPSTSPLSFGLAELALGSAGLLITIPLETVRKRLQIQSRADFVRAGRAGGTGRAWRTCVEVRPRPYAGVVEAVYRILSEETGRIPRRRRRQSSNSRPNTPGLSEKPPTGAGGAVFVEEKEDLNRIGLGVGSGLTQLYRGLGMGLAAQVVVFLLGLVANGGEGGSGGWAEM